MTVTYITPATSVIATSGNGANMIWGDSLTLLPGAYVGTTAATGYGISVTGTSALRSTLNVMGTVAADFGGIYLRDMADGLANITVAQSGIITAQRYAIQSAGSTSLQTLTLHNDGAITSATGPAIIASNSNLTIVNTGLIAGLHDGAAIFTSGAGTWVDIVNSGTLTGGISATCAPGGLIEVENSGLIQGDLGLGDGLSGAIWLRNSGLISGSVTISGQAGHSVTAELSGGTIAGALQVSTEGTLSVDLSDARINGNVALTGGHDLTMLRLSNAIIAGDFLYNNTAGSFGTLDLTGLQLGGLMELAVFDVTCEFHAGQIGGLLGGVGADQFDMTGGTVLGLIDLDSGNDTLNSGSGREQIREHLGDDSYSLGGGDDIVVFGVGPVSDGTDTLDGGAGFDTLNFSRVSTDQLFTASDGALWVSLDEGLSRGATSNPVNHFGLDQISGFEAVVGGAFADTLIGNAKANRLAGGTGDDTLSGNGGADTLLGGDGSDRIVGGAGRDVMRGDAGADVFAFAAATDSGVTRAARDQIVDFLHLTDRISLAAIDATTALAGDQSFTFAGQTATSGAGTVRFGHDHGDTVIQLNLDADTAAESTILLRGLIALTAADFLL